MNEIQGRLRNATPWHIWSLVFGIAVLLMGFGLQVVAISALGGVAMSVGSLAGYIVYRKKRTTHVEYHLDAHYGQKYSRLLAGFEQLKRCERLWRVDTTAAVQNRKYHAGAKAILTRRKIAASLGVPSFLRVNIKLPVLHSGRRSLYFLPDLVLIVEGGSIGAISYPNFKLDIVETRFIEDGYAPRDSQQVGSTWRYVNKAGGPDRRFANNKQLPILRYGELNLWSNTGLNERIQASSVAAANGFGQGLSSMTQP